MKNFTSMKNWLAFSFLLMSGTAMAQTNLLSNASFEEWSGDEPAHWVSTTTAGNGTISQATDARTGSSSILLKGTTSNKRLASEEITLKAGTYIFSIYAKAATEENASARPGYAPVNEDGSMGAYMYGVYHNDITNANWVLVADTFTLDADTKLNLVVMNPKSPGKDLLLDDASLTTEDGGIVEGGSTVDPTPSETYTYTKAAAVESGVTYLLAAPVEKAVFVAKNVSESNKYGYLYCDSIGDATNTIELEKTTNNFVLTSVDGGYTIQDSYGRYLYMTGNYNSFNVSSERTDGDVWSIEANADGTFKITNVAMNKYIQYSLQYKSYGAYADENGVMPYLYKFDKSSTGISSAVEDNINAPVEVYNLSGVKVGSSLDGLSKGIYLVKKGNKVQKVLK